MTNSGRMKIMTVPSEFNQVDHLTRAKAWHEIEKLIPGVGDTWRSWSKRANVKRTVIVDEDVARSTRCGASELWLTATMRCCQYAAQWQSDQSDTCCNVSAKAAAVTSTMTNEKGAFNMRPDLERCQDREVLVRINRQSFDVAGGVHVDEDDVDVGVGDREA